MKYFGLSAALAMALAVFATPVRAEVIDMAALTCGDFIKEKPDDIGIILIWMHGYFGGLANDTTLDTKSLGDASGALGGYCAKNPTVTVMTAIKKLGS